MDNEIKTFLQNIGKELVIYGCGAIGKTLYALANEAGIKIIAFCDKDSNLWGEKYGGLSILSPQQAGEKYGQKAAFLCAVGAFQNSASLRKEWEHELYAHGCKDILYVPWDLMDSLKKHTLQNKTRGSLIPITEQLYMDMVHGAFFSQNITTEYTVVSNHEGRVFDQPEDYDSVLYIMGGSVAKSFTQDKTSLASRLQAHLNNHRQRILVRNYGVSTSIVANSLLQIPQLPITQGDRIVLVRHISHGDDVDEQVSFILALHHYCTAKKVFFLAVLSPIEEEVPLSANHDEGKAIEYDEAYELLRLGGCPCLSLKLFISESGLLEHDDLYIDGLHYGEFGNDVVAQFICSSVIRQKAVPSVAVEEMTKRAVQATANLIKSKLDKTYQESILPWIKHVALPNIPPNCTIGAVVMNCNPMTNGHIYLIKQARACVDYLYVFIVEEDSSEFTFQERYHLVQKCLSTLNDDRIILGPSGAFVLSSLTFGEYFKKSVIMGDVDSSMDIYIFGGMIAPALGITHRFIGEEPYCNVTKQYNETINFLLPKMGIDVHTITRIGSTQEPVISASKVRKYLMSNELSKIKPMVPEPTYEYLAANQKVLRQRFENLMSPP